MYPAKIRTGVYAAPQPRKPNRCHLCNRGFGLIRHRFALRQFCSKACVAEYRTTSERELSRLEAWRNFLARK